MNFLFSCRLTAPVLLATCLLTACGGGKSSSERPAPPTSKSSAATVLSSSSSSSSVSSASSSSSSVDPNVWQAGVFHPETHFANMCSAPRHGDDPTTGKAYPDRQGSYIDENNFLRAVSNDLYLWYNEIVDVNPSAYFDVTEYFSLLKTPALTPSGNAKDRFHWFASTAELKSNTEQALVYGYGISWKQHRGKIQVSLVEPHSVAEKAGVIRGMTLHSVDGIRLDILSTDEIAPLTDALYPSQQNVSHSFVFKTADNQLKTLTLTAADTDLFAVHVTRLLQVDGRERLYGYLLFNTHHNFSEYELIDSIEWLKQHNVDQLILDLRYNGGGYLDIASQLGYMIAGHHVQDKVFEEMVFNDKHRTLNPVSGEALTPIGFHKTSQGFAVTAGKALPTLNLSSVIIITGEDTCSASEAIINGLIGADIEVTLIGDTTCGKPYGAYIIDNCGMSYFTTQFTGKNHKGFGEYSDGFIPTNNVFFPSPAYVKGCMIEDDFTKQLGDFNEKRLNAALYYDVYKECPPTTNAARASQGTVGSSTNLVNRKTNDAVNSLIRKAPGTNDKIMRHPQ